MEERVHWEVGFWLLFVLSCLFCLVWLVGWFSFTWQEYKLYFNKLHRCNSEQINKVSFGQKYKLIYVHVILEVQVMLTYVSCGVT